MLKNMGFSPYKERVNSKSVSIWTLLALPFKHLVFYLKDLWFWNTNAFNIFTWGKISCRANSSMNTVQYSSLYCLIFSEVGTHNHLSRKWTLNHLAKLTLKVECSFSWVIEWLSVHSRIKWLWVRISLLSIRIFRYGACFKKEVSWHSGKL